MPRYLVWNDYDPNDSFVIEGADTTDAAFTALDELGWAISAEPIEDEDEA